VPPFDLLQPQPYDAPQAPQETSLFGDLLDKYLAWRKRNLDASLQNPAMMALGMTAPVGAVGRGGRALLRRSNAPEQGLGGRPAPGETIYAIDMPGQANAGYVLINKIENGVAHIDDIVLGKNQLGPAGVRDLLGQLRQYHPEIKALAGERVSGARFGGGRVPLGEGQSTTAPAGQLPMDTASRMARAKAQGFDGPYYHGTQKNFDAFDISKAGSGAGSAGEKGVYLTKDPRLASHYTYGEGVVMPLNARLGKAKEVRKSYYNSHELGS